MDLPNNRNFCFLHIIFTSNHNSQLFMLYKRLVHVDKTLTDFQILGCDLHKNAFGGRSLPGPAGELTCPQTS